MMVTNARHFIEASHDDFRVFIAEHLRFALILLSAGLPRFYSDFQRLTRLLATPF